MLPEQPDARSPAGAEIRYLMDGPTGNVIHSTVPPHQVNRATVHATVSEFRYVPEGPGEIWRDDGTEKPRHGPHSGQRHRYPRGHGVPVPICLGR